MLSRASIEFAREVQDEHQFNFITETSTIEVVQPVTVRLLSGNVVLNTDITLGIDGRLDLYIRLAELLQVHAALIRLSFQNSPPGFEVYLLSNKDAPGNGDFQPFDPEGRDQCELCYRAVGVAFSCHTCGAFVCEICYHCPVLNQEDRCWHCMEAMDLPTVRDTARRLLLCDPIEQVD